MTGSGMNAFPFQRAGGWCEPVRRIDSKSPMNCLPNPVGYLPRGCRLRRRACVKGQPVIAGGMSKIQGGTAEPPPLTLRFTT